jgi:large subunit ribosomal protein L5
MAQTTASKPATANYIPRLKQEYNNKISKELLKELELKNINDVPRFEKIVINSGLGRAKDEKRLLDVASNTIRKITGQQPITTVAKVSIASFKLREGNRIGVKATLRGDRMYEFADRLINIVMPRLRDFHGVSAKAFDKQGNYSVGLSDQSVFPELSYEDTATAHGMQVIFVIKSKSPEHSRALLEKFGMPFEKGDR